MTRKFLSFLFFILFLLQNLNAQVTINQFPKNLQLYARNTTTNTANVLATGSISESTAYTSVYLEVYREGVLQNTYTQALSYISGNASFSFSVSIVAELANYNFRLYSNTNILLKETINVVAGDVYIYSGQSNMEGWGENFNEPTNPFLRSFFNTATGWELAYYNAGGIAFKSGLNIVTNLGIPVAIFNGAEGGRPIAYFQRNDVNKYDTTTNYGRLLSRLSQAEITKVRAFSFYQGEADGVNGSVYYTNLFTSFITDMLEDYNFEKTYIFQVRKGCGAGHYTNDVYEAQRQLSLSLPNTTLISTNGVLKYNDVCHYNYSNGYAILGTRLYNAIAHQIYSTGSPSGIYAPQISNPRFITADKNIIQFTLSPNTDSYTWENGVEADFAIENNTSVNVVSGSVLGNTVTLYLSGSVTVANPLLTYFGQNLYDFPFIKNQTGIGMPSFRGLPINTANVISVEDNGWTYYYYEGDINTPIFGIEKTPSGSGANTLSFSSQVSIFEGSNYFSKIAGKDATFCMNKYWNTQNSPIPNGWVNIRFFYNPISQTSFETAAANFAYNNGALYLSPTIFITANSYINPASQLYHLGFNNLSIKKLGTTATYGSYNGFDYLQNNEVIFDNITGGALIRKIQSGSGILQPGYIRFNSATQKFQGYTGIEWVDFN